MRGAAELQSVLLSTYICRGGHCCAFNTRTSATSQTLAATPTNRLCNDFRQFYEDLNDRPPLTVLLRLC